MHGPNVGKMKAMVRDELHKEKEVVAGNGGRNSITINEAVPGEGFISLSSSSKAKPVFE